MLLVVDGSLLLIWRKRFNHQVKKQWFGTRIFADFQSRI